MFSKHYRICSPSQKQPCYQSGFLPWCKSYNDSSFVVEIWNLCHIRYCEGCSGSPQLYYTYTCTYTAVWEVRSGVSLSRNCVQNRAHKTLALTSSNAVERDTHYTTTAITVCRETEREGGGVGGGVGTREGGTFFHVQLLEWHGDLLLASWFGCF